MAEAPAEWWIAEDLRGTHLVSGPFGTRELAFYVRGLLEHVESPQTFAIVERSAGTVPAAGERSAVGAERTELVESSLVHEGLVVGEIRLEGGVPVVQLDLGWCRAAGVGVRILGDASRRPRENHVRFLRVPGVEGD